MKILFFSRLFYPHVGGVEKHVFNISEILVRRGHDVTVITEKYEYNQKVKETVKGIRIIRIDVDGSSFLKKFKIWYWLLINKSVINKSDIVHCHDIFFWYLPFRFIYPRKKVYTTFHGYEGNNIPGIKSILMHKIAEKLSYGNICIGEFLKKWYGTHPTIISYGAVSMPKSINKPKSKRNVLFIGRLEEETGIRAYLKALKLLKDKNINIKLEVLGDGSLKEECISYAKRNDLAVEFKGFVSNINAYLQNSSIIFTSRYLGILEALSYRRAVISHYNNAIKHDYLTMTPFYKSIVVCSSSNEIAQSVADCLKNNTLATSDAYSWVRKESWNKMVDIYKKLWRI